MITRKHLLFVIAATCLLTMFAVTIVPIKSQTAGKYEPWLDTNDDGKMDGKDIALNALATLAFGTAGSPTKNVNVTNNILKVNGTDNQNVTIESFNYYSSTVYFTVPTPDNQALAYHIFSIAGFRQVSLDVRAFNSSAHNLWIMMGSFDNAGNSYYTSFLEMLPTITKNVTGTIMQTDYFETLAVQGPQLYVGVWQSMGQTSTDFFSLSVYVTC